MNKICKEYISEIKALFPIKGKQERAYIKKVMADIEDFCEEANVASKQELYDNYGNPNDVVHNYLSAVDTAYIAKQIRITRYIKTFVIALLVLATIAASALCLYLYSEYQIYKRQEVIGMETSVSEIN